MRKGMILVGALGVALVVFGVGIARSRLPLPERLVRAVGTLGKDTRPMPPLPDLPRDLSTLSDVEAVAFLYIDDHLFTRFDSARAVNDIPCDEGMPERVLFAADGRVLDVAQQQSSFHARIELVSVGEAAVWWNGCTPNGTDVEQRIRTDTVSLTLSREAGSWTFPYHEVLRGYEHLPLAGPLTGIANADWPAISATADSVRLARGHQPARPRTASGTTHFAQEPGGYLRYPGSFAIPCPAAETAPPATDRAELAYVDPEYAPNFSTILGTWWTIYEPRDSAGRSCVTQVRLKFVQSYVHYCGNQENRGAAVYAADSFASRPLLLVRSVDGLRTGLQRKRFSTMPVPGWARGVLVYSDSGEAFRVIETPDGDGGGHYLTVDYGGKSYPIKHGEPNETWGIYWAGQLNGDDIPDFVLRSTVPGTDMIRHDLILFLSSPGQGDERLWTSQRHAFVRICH
jgi:hypothetical protein